ncbi:MAG TPA: glucodextranase DOMON-like domain-containing protein, partial [Vicinamibacteria bacterium]|nr:glucodextranase DOMON-like domain-containing protein [Vicinamibacteria bacterium]
DPQSAWEKMICLTPRPVETKGLLKRYLVKVLEEKLETSRGRVDPEDTSEIFADASLDLERSYYFPERGVRVAGRKLTFLVPSSFLGGTAKGEWSYVVLLTVAKIDDTLSFGNFGGAEVPYTLMNLPVGEGGWSDRLGTTRKGAALLPPILDMFVPEGMKQEEILRNFNANTKQMVVLPGIVPSDDQR